MPVDAVLNPVAAPSSAALRSPSSGAFDAEAFDSAAFDVGDSGEVPVSATVQTVAAPTPATLDDA